MFSITFWVTLGVIACGAWLTTCDIVTLTKPEDDTLPIPLALLSLIIILIKSPWKITRNIS